MTESMQNYPAFKGLNNLKLFKKLKIVIPDNNRKNISK